MLLIAMLRIKSYKKWQAMLRIKNYKKWQNNLPDISDDLLRCPETILNGVYSTNHSSAD